MLKRQDTLLSSSSRRETPPPENNHAKAIGCMAGIFQLISKYQHRRKFLTFGKKQQEKHAVLLSPSPTKDKPSASVGMHASPSIKEGNKICDVRSPTLPPEIRRSNSINSPQNFRTRPTLVMGSEGIPATAESTSENRKKLLGALAKCDKDLKSLKKIIESVRLSDHLYSPPVAAEVSATGDFSLSNFSKRHPNGRMGQQQMPIPRKKPGEEEVIHLCLFNKVFQPNKWKKTAASPLGSSKAMVKSVDEVCRDIAWGEKREVKRIELVLQDYIFRDIIEETVRELECCFIYSLPLHSCKKRLCF